MCVCVCMYPKRTNLKNQDSLDVQPRNIGIVDVLSVGILDSIDEQIHGIIHDLRRSGGLVPGTNDKGVNYLAGLFQVFVSGSVFGQGASTSVIPDRKEFSVSFSMGAIVKGIRTKDSNQHFRVSRRDLSSPTPGVGGCTSFVVVAIAATAAA